MLEDTDLEMQNTCSSTPNYVANSKILGQQIWFWYIQTQAIKFAVFFKYSVTIICVSDSDSIS